MFELWGKTPRSDGDNTLQIDTVEQSLEHNVYGYLSWCAGVRSIEIGKECTLEFDPVERYYQVIDAEC